MYIGMKASLSILALVIAAVAVFPAPVSAHGTTLTITTDTTLTADLTGHIVIDADDITLNCADHSVTGDGSGIGILLIGRTGVTVENCRVIDFEAGFLLLDSGPDNDLTGNTANGNSFVGFHLFSSSGNTLTENVANDNFIGFNLDLASDNTLERNTANDNFWGFVLGGSSDNTLEENTANGNVDSGFFLIESSDNNLTGNNATGNSIGFILFDLASDNNLTGNNATGNSHIGFILESSSGNILTENTANDNGDGFLLLSFDDNTLEYNAANDNSFVGFHLFSSSWNVLTGNTANDNGDSGFTLELSDDNTLERNTANNNADDGFRLIESSSGNTLERNTANGNVLGFSVESSSWNVLTENTANRNGRSFTLGSSSGNTLTGNTAIGSFTGFHLFASSENTLTGNTASFNHEGYALFDSSDGNTLRTNRAECNFAGFVAVFSIANMIFRNDVILNTIQASDTNPALNDWHDPVLEEGNFWSDYPGADDGSGTGKHAIAGDGIGDTDVPFPFPDGDNFPLVSPIVSRGACGVFLVMDEDSIDNGSPPNIFSDVAVNDHVADIGLRAQLLFFAANVGSTITLHTGEVGDEGWFAPKTIPASWDAAGPTPDGLRNYLAAGPGLGNPDANGDREALLDKIPDVTPLRATGLKQLEGRAVCAVVYDGDIGINYDPLDGSLKGDNLGIVAFKVLSVTDLTGFSSSSLPQVEVEILDADFVCEGSLVLFTDAPEPASSSEPFDVSVKG